MNTKEDTAMEKLRKMKFWLEYHREIFLDGIKSIADLEKLYDYAIKHPHLDEMADTWTPRSLKIALGYDPWSELL